MRKREAESGSGKILVDTATLMQMLSVGRDTADRIGKDAGAAIKIGRRRLFNVSKVRTYIDALGENEDG